MLMPLPLKNALIFGALLLPLAGCGASSPSESAMDWGNADYAQIICASPGAGCKTGSDEEKLSLARGHHSKR